MNTDGHGWARRMGVVRWGVWAAVMAVGVAMAGCARETGRTMTAPAAVPATMTRVDDATSVAGLTCAVQAMKEKVPFNERPRFVVTLTNVSRDPIDLMATAEERGGLPGSHHPCAAVKITGPNGRYFIQSEDGAKINPKAVRIEPGKSWSFAFPSQVSETVYGTGTMPSLFALLPGTYTAEICYSVREEEKGRLAANTVYGEETGALAGKRPERLWEGVARSAPVKFEVLADDSKPLAILRAVYAGEGGKSLKLELKVEDGANGVMLHLRAKNAGTGTIYMGDSYGLVVVGPEGRTWEDFGGLRSGVVGPIEPGEEVDLHRWSLGGQAPGKHVVRVRYETPLDKVVAESNSVEVAVPKAAGVGK